MGLGYCPDGRHIEKLALLYLLHPCSRSLAYIIHRDVVNADIA